MRILAEPIEAIVKFKTKRNRYHINSVMLTKKKFTMKSKWIKS